MPAPPLTTAEAPRIGDVEQHGIDTIPAAERSASPSTLFWVFAGAQLSFTVIIYGWLPITFGLGWWSAVSAIVVGLAVGTLIYAPFALFGPRTGTNSAVSSGAHFGVVGRVIGSVLAMVTAIGFFAISVWTGGDALVAGAHSLVGTPDGDVAAAVCYGVMAVLTVLIAVYGYAMVVAAQKFVIPVLGALMLLGVIALASKFDAGYSGSGEYLLGSFTNTWLLAALTTASMPVSYAPFANDYSRYIPEGTSDRTVTIANGAGVFVGGLFVCLFGAYMASIFGADDASFVTGLVSISPQWYVGAVILLGLLGNFGQGSVCLYGTGLDFSSLVPHLKRVPATIAIGAVSVVLVFVGRFAVNAVDSVTAFVIILVVVITPWVVINLIGFVQRRGWYDPLDLQVFNAGGRGGRYWFTAGWNFRAVGALVPAVFVGLMCTTTTLFTGPWAGVANGIDMSLVSGSVIAAVLYLVLTAVFPEPAEVRGHVAVTTPTTAVDIADLAPAKELA
jgi:purine-cytosine permease-like protein